MRNEDADAFDAVMNDLCLAFNRPATAELTRVFWESLKWAHIADVRRMAIKHRNTAKKFPTPKDLTPERAAAAPAPKAPEPYMSSWAIAANRILFVCCFQDSRGFNPVGKYPPMSPDGLGLPLNLAPPLDDLHQRKLLAVKRDYVRMAEEAQANGDTWSTVEFNRMCREGFQAIIADADRMFG